MVLLNLQPDEIQFKETAKAAFKGKNKGDVMKKNVLISQLYVGFVVIYVD